MSEGDWIASYDGSSENCLIVFNGTIEERHTSETGRYTVSRVYSRGHVILPPGFRPDRLDQISRVAVTPCEVGETKTSIFWNYLLSRPELTQFFLAQCVEDLDEIMSRLVDANLVPVRERLRRELLKRANEQGSGQAAKIHIRSHDEFAAYLGANRETVSREISRLSRLGAIETSRGHILVTNVERLRTVS
ncbi:Crp/Fnr family transcriptional regulator [Henriciella sp.]|uniref:Crp/Fnr family transcriptional regulator n=1 Tax=Henriciella sp. TaxID=1968823 RepID=UPI002601F35B|nr:Crp/Fnr family transcriptional regulator [Henriciella sp.]